MNEEVGEVGIQEKDGEKAVDILRELEHLAATNGLNKDSFKEFVRLNFGRVDTLEKLEEVKSYVEKNVEKIRRLCGLINEINRVASVDSGVLKVLETVKPSAENVNKLDEAFRQYLTENMTVNIICNTATLRNFVKSVEILSEEALVTCNQEEDGVVVRAVDPSNVAMVIASLNPDYVGGAAMFGLSFSDMDRYLKFVPAKSTCEMNVKYGEMTVKITPEKDTDSPLKIKVKLIDPTAIRKVPRVPNLDFNARMTIYNFSKIISLLGTNADYVIFEVTDDGGRIIAKDNENEIEVEIPDASGEGRALYSMEYLKEFAKVFSKLGDTVDVRFSTDMPAEFVCEEDELSVKYILAPRIEA